MKRILLSMAITLMACAAVFAQVPTVMMYQVQIMHKFAAPQDVTVEMQLRKSQNGAAIWSQIFNLKEVKNNSIQNLGLDFGDKVDLSDGEYWLATIVNNEEMGCAKLTSVPYSMVTKYVEGVITPKELIGKWEFSNEDTPCPYTEIYDFKEDGTFTIDDDSGYDCGSGTWKLGGQGNLYVRGGKYQHDYHDLAITYYDRENGLLFITGGNNNLIPEYAKFTKLTK